MSQTPQPSAPVPQGGFDFKAWWQRLGLSGKLLMCGGVAGLVFAFLPAWSMKATGMMTGASRSISVFQIWQGKLGFLGFIGCAVVAYLMYQPQVSPKQRQLLYGLLGSAGLAVLMVLWLFFELQGTGMSVASEFASVSAGTGIGMYLSLLAAIAVGVGAGLKAREERLF